MTVQGTPPVLGDRFATELRELALPWEAAPAREPRLLVLDERLAAEAGLDPEFLRSPEGLGLLLGTTVPAGATPVAQAYAGHQFGGYSPRLGDGRALLMGELPDGRDLHLKGSGRTPFSRGGDGLAAVGPMLREYVISAAMHALGIPTTRSLAVVATGGSVLREQGALPGAVLARVAASHLRVGTFQYARATDDPALLRRLADHAIARHHTDVAGAENPYLEFYSAVVDAQADLVARWMNVGFIHGVMNTDNTTISGETIDYGPCAFLEAVDPATVFSSIDTGGRYAFGNQPSVLQWNLARFAETLIPLVDPDPSRAVELLTERLARFPDRYVAAWESGLRDKLGLAGGGDREGDDDEVVRPLIDDLIAILTATRVDHTSFFHRLTAAADGRPDVLRDLFAAAPGGVCSAADPGAEAGEDPGPVDAWLARWRRLGPSVATMARANPVYIPRNHLVEEALDAATAGDLGPVERLLAVVARPFDERPGLERYARPAPPDAAPFVTYCGT